MTLSLLLALSSCGGGNASAAQNVFGGTETAQNGDQSLAGKKVGIAMPTQSSERWINDGKNMKAKLEAKGAEVVLQFGDDDI